MKISKIIGFLNLIVIFSTLERHADFLYMLLWHILSLFPPIKPMMLKRISHLFVDYVLIILVFQGEYIFFFYKGCHERNKI